MNSLTYFESRSGTLTCKPVEVFVFVTDIRNFGQFIPKGSIDNWKAEKESCSFGVSLLGTVAVRLTTKEEYNKVVFNGDAFKKNDFTLTLNISENVLNTADVKVMLSAELNQMMKMMAVNPINQFLEILIKEMENFRGWTVIT
jgi:hypothetical protein